METWRQKPSTEEDKRAIYVRCLRWLLDGLTSA